MNQLLELVAFGSLAVIVYIYIGYPVVLFFLQLFVRRRRVDESGYLPHVSLLISCFNEEDVIKEKILNSFALDYPKELIEIIVISDASNDRTDEIVRSFNVPGLRFLRQQDRKGKTAGLNSAVKIAKGEIIVFSDANAMYEPDSIRKLVRNFSDSCTGYVVGEARYRNAGESSSAQSENLYWRYEVLLKRCESRLHSIVGADGAIYATRRELYEDLLETDINDFVNPLQIVLKGYRGVYEPEAVCWEDPAGSFSGEFSRKVRIVNRSFSGFLRLAAVSNPFKTGLFSFEIISHKLLRWFTHVFIASFMFSVVLLAVSGGIFYKLAALPGIIFLAFAYTGFVMRERKKISRIFSYPYYFILVNIAAFKGLKMSIRGSIQATWNSIRGDLKPSGGAKENSFRRVHIAAVCLLVFALWLLKEIFELDISFAKSVFWSSFLLMVYIYFGYPCSLIILGIIKSRRHKKKAVFPEVTLLVCAFNEESVIEEKIENMLSLDYPEDKLSFAIASDGSDDDTGGIVKGHPGYSRLLFFEYPKRRGKVSVICDTVPLLPGEIIILSDANTMFKPDAVRNLVRSFHDPEVGGVSSDVILVNERTTYGKSESAYYKYERWIQRRETRIGSIVGADGGMYAIRKKLFVPPSKNIILDDFVISMSIVNNGYRLVYDEEAVACERSITTWREEFSRKSRVIAGAVQALKQSEGIPESGFSTVFFCFLSHKLLRWMVPFFLIIFFAANLRLIIFSGILIYRFTFWAQLAFYGLALAGLFRQSNKSPLLKIPFYFCLVNGAALYGIYKGIFDKQPVRWRKVSR